MVITASVRLRRTDNLYSSDYRQTNETEVKNLLTLCIYAYDLAHHDQ